MKPRLGFLGVGWIGRHRLEALAAHGGVEIAAIADPSRERRDACLAIAPDARPCAHLGQLLEIPLDGIVVATPNALHAEHCLAVLERGRAVFCQKPLARTATETRRVVDFARERDRLLGVDLSYRHTTAMQHISEVVRTGGIGRPFAIDLVFHNAYGPDAQWFYDKTSSGGGCVLDLGAHLIDLAMWLTGFPAVHHVASRLFAAGDAIEPSDRAVEDYAEIQLDLEGGIVARVACSWRLSAGCDAVIAATVYGTAGGVSLKNVDGSFYDFIAERYHGTRSELIASPPDSWGGRAALDWALRLGAGMGFDPQAEHLVELAEVLDSIYQRGAA